MKMRFFGKNLAAALAGAVALVALSAASHASTVSIYSTGVDNSGNVVAGADQHYTSPTGPTTPYLHPAYAPNGADSQWIGGSTFPAFVPVDYTVHFTLAEAGDAILTGSWGVDNEGLDILINGNSTGISLLGLLTTNFSQLHSFATTLAQSAFFHVGDNTLTFRIQDLGNPGALRTAGLSVTATPIPPAILLFMTALGGMGFLGYRRRGASAAA
jgi:hypothetical protein